MKDRLLRARVAMIVVSLLLAAVGYTWIVRANFTTALTVQVTYPKSTSGTTTVGGTGDHQVFRPNAVAPETAVSSSGPIFGGLNPKTDLPARGLAFLFNNQASIGNNDYVYAFKINNAADTGPLIDFRTGRCSDRITSIGYYARPGAINPTSGFLSPSVTVFNFPSNADPTNIIPPGGTSAILFFTSPDPPSRVSTFIGGTDITGPVS